MIHDEKVSRYSPSSHRFTLGDTHRYMNPFSPAVSRIYSRAVFHGIDGAVSNITLFFSAGHVFKDNLLNRQQLEEFFAGPAKHGAEQGILVDEGVGGVERQAGVIFMDSECNRQGIRIFVNSDLIFREYSFVPVIDSLLRDYVFNAQKRIGRVAPYLVSAPWS